MQLEEFQPRSALVAKQSFVDQPRFPVVDAHNHLAEPFGGGWDRKPPSQLLDILDQANVQLYIDLDGGWGEDTLNFHLNHFKAFAPNRFKIFGGVDWDQWPVKGNTFPNWAANRLRIQKERGAEGLKIWKNFGLTVRDQRGELAAVDDPRLDVIWHTAAELNLPVIIHVADPVAFFEPLDANNERWEELNNHPDWHFPSTSFPPFLDIVNAMARLIEGHPATTFIGAHVGCYAENLSWVSQVLDRCANFYVDISARIGELGRQPYSARRFFLKYADRILFGLDLGPELAAYRLQYRFLETDDEYFSYNTSPIPLQGRWYVHGLYLPDDVLEKIYLRNFTKIFPDVRISL
jgi:predicted TIM-barrel fold metal-dependent hydrolase